MIAISRQKKENKQTINIIRRYGNMGDLLMLTPVLKELSGSKKIILHTLKKYVDIFANLDFIHDLCALNTNKQISGDIIDISDYEYNYEHTYQPNIEKTKQELFADALNVKLINPTPIISITNEEISNIKKILNNNYTNQKIILLAIKSTSKDRDWPIENWKKLIEKIKFLNYKLIVVDEKIKWADDKILFFKAKNFRELFAITKFASLVVTSDSGMLHIAGAFAKPCVSLFGPTDPKVRCIYKNSYFVKANLSCAPCWYNRCTRPNCMNLITVGSVENKIMEVIQNAQDN